MRPVICAELEAELEARQNQNPESLRGVHEQVIRLVDNMVQNYLDNVRRTIQRVTNFVDNQRSNAKLPNKHLAPGSPDIQSENVISGQFVEGFAHIRQSILNRIQSVSKNMHDFTMQWTRAVGKQQSPLIDRIPPRGVELWRDFWDTVRKQVRRINQEVYQIGQDMSRLITGRLPGGPRAESSSLSQLYLPASDQFAQLHRLMSEGLQASELKFAAPVDAMKMGEQGNNNLIEESDDDATKDELTRNVALRQQIQQEINVFGSIFDILRTFIQRLRESATNVVRDVIQPGATNNNNNDPVTPGPSVKPELDKLLEETIESQRIINGQAKPVLLPNKRVVAASQG